MRTLYYSELPRIMNPPHGYEGLILKMSETECIKVYSPQISLETAQLEFDNHRKLLDKSIFTSEPREIVKIKLDRPDIMLPIGTSTGPELFHYLGTDETFGLIRTYLGGKVYGRDKINCDEVSVFYDYLINLIKEDMIFFDSFPYDFVMTQVGVGCVDCTNLVDLKDKKDNLAAKFSFITSLINNYVEMDYNNLDYNAAILLIKKKQDFIATNTNILK